MARRYGRPAPLGLCRILRGQRGSFEPPANPFGSPPDMPLFDTTFSGAPRVRPFDTAYSERLQAINEEHGFEAEEIDTELIKAKFAPVEAPAEHANSDLSVYENKGFVTAGDLLDQKIDAHMPSFTIERAGKSGDDHEVVQATAVADNHGSGLEPVAELKLQKEIDSISFYIENGYHELAEKAVEALEQEFGERPEIAALKTRMAVQPDEHVAAHSIGIDEMRSEFGLDENDVNADDDFDTHYHTAVAYQEMGLLEEAIREYQDAIVGSTPTDGSRRFFQCANLLGHCFMQNSMPHFAVKWFLRALETPALNDDELQGIWYELGMAYEAEGDAANAAKYFEQVYAENVDFRDVSDRVKHMLVSH